MSASKRFGNVICDGEFFSFAPNQDTTVGISFFSDGNSYQSGMAVFDNARVTSSLAVKDLEIASDGKLTIALGASVESDSTDVSFATIAVDDLNADTVNADTLNAADVSVSSSGSLSIHSAASVDCDSTDVSMALARIDSFFLGDTVSYADNAAAIAAGKTVGELYHTEGDVKCVTAA